MNVKLDTRRSFQVKLDRTEFLSLVRERIQEEPLTCEGVEVSDLPEKVEVFVCSGVNTGSGYSGGPDEVFLTQSGEILISWVENS